MGYNILCGQISDVGTDLSWISLWEQIVIGSPPIRPRKGREGKYATSNIISTCGRGRLWG